MNIDNKAVFEAYDYLANNENCHFANGPSNSEAFELVKSFYKLGAYKVTTSSYKNSYNGEWEFGEELYLHLPKQISLDLMMEIVLSRPDEISQEDDGSIRLWWD